jgi:hypothetical protein
MIIVPIFIIIGYVLFFSIKCSSCFKKTRATFKEMLDGKEKMEALIDNVNVALLLLVTSIAGGSCEPFAGPDTACYLFDIANILGIYTCLVSSLFTVLKFMRCSNSVVARAIAKIIPDFVMLIGSLAGVYFVIMLIVEYGIVWFFFLLLLLFFIYLEFWAVLIEWRIIRDNKTIDASDFEVDDAEVIADNLLAASSFFVPIATSGMGAGGSIQEYMDVFGYVAAAVALINALFTFLKQSKDEKKQKRLKAFVKLVPDIAMVALSFISFGALFSTSSSATGHFVITLVLVIFSFAAFILECYLSCCRGFTGV